MKWHLEKGILAEAEDRKVEKKIIDIVRSNGNRARIGRPTYQFDKFKKELDAQTNKRSQEDDKDLDTITEDKIDE